MTKRAGKKKHRNGTQRHPPGKISRPDTIEGPDNLKPKESLKLEVKALTEGWLVGPEHAVKRRMLMERLLDKGLSEDASPDEMSRILRTVSQAEIQAIRTLLAAEKAAKDTKPVVIVQQNNNQVDTLAELIDRMNPDEAQEFLNRHGSKLRDVLPSDRGRASEPAVIEASSKRVMQEAH